MRKALSWMVVGVLVAMLLVTGCAQKAPGGSSKVEYPKQPINVLIGFAPGGGSDMMLSMVRPGLEKELKTTLVPVYKPGSGSDIALGELKGAKPDGYTVVIACTPNVNVNPVVRQTQYQLSDFAFVANVVTDPGILVVKKDSPYKTLDEFISAARANPGKITVGVSSAPGDDWFAMHMVEEAVNVDVNIVPFSGDGPSWQAALAGHVDASSNNLSIVYPQIKAGELRPLAIMSEQRSPYLPDVPTFMELGYKFTSGSSRGFAMPKDTPKEIVDIFAKAVKTVMDSEEFKARASEGAFPVDYRDPANYTAYMQKLQDLYRDLWGKYGKEAETGK